MAFENITLLNNKRTDGIVFIASILVCFYWIGSQYTNVYKFAAVGAIFEMTSIPMLLLFIILPVLSIFLFIKDKFSFKNFSIYSFLLLLTTFLVLNFKVLK